MLQNNKRNIKVKVDNNKGEKKILKNKKPHTTIFSGNINRLNAMA